jgi:ABC-type transport system substrate-binding protein
LQGQRSEASPTPGAGSAPTTTTPTGSPLEPVEPARPGGKLVVAVPADVNGWNPNIDQWTDGGTMMGPSMLEPLANVNADGEAEPFLAESWVNNPDHTEWAVTVKDGIRFHNGQPLDARAVKRSLDAYALTGLSSIELKNIYERVEVTGPRTVTVTLKTPWAQFPASLVSAYMLAPAMLDREDQGTVYPIGTGPFRYVDWQAGKWLKVSRFDGYWRHDRDGGQLPHLAEIEFRPVLADNARMSALGSGQVDLALTSDPGTATAFADDHTVIRDSSTERTLLLLQTDEGEGNRDNPFTNLHARRALVAATDNRELARLVGPDVEVTTQMFHPGSRWGMPAGETGYHGYDPETARRELAAYVRETGRRDLRFTLKSVPEPRLLAVLQRAQAQWRALGIEASIDTLDQVKFSIVVALGQYQAAYFRGYGFPNPDLNHWLLARENRHPVGELSLNFTHYQSSTLEHNLRTQRESTDFAVRKPATDAIVREINDQALHIWLFDTPWAIVARQDVRGLDNFRMHPFGNFDSKPWWGDVWIKS